MQDVPVDAVFTQLQEPIRAETYRMVWPSEKTVDMQTVWVRFDELGLPRYVRIQQPLPQEAAAASWPAFSQLESGNAPSPVNRKTLSVPSEPDVTMAEPDLATTPTPSIASPTDLPFPDKQSPVHSPSLVWQAPATLRATDGATLTSPTQNRLTPVNVESEPAVDPFGGFLSFALIVVLVLLGYPLERMLRVWFAR